jgi:hypothetical protein
MKRRYKTLLAALALAAVAAAGAGIARSTSTEPIPDANGVIHACYKKPIGEVKIVYSAANCGAGQAPIEWNQAGPQGPKGDPGPQGPPGPPGAAGGADVQAFESDEIEGDIEIGPLPTGIFVTLGEPGTYWVFAKGMMQRDSNSVADRDKEARADCELELGFTRLDTTPTMLLQFDHPADEVWFTLADVAQATQAGQRLKLVCRHTFGSDGELPISLFAPRIYALKLS